MGQCYSIALRVKFTDAAGAVKAMQQKIERGEEERINYNIEKFKSFGVVTDSVWGLLRVVFADWPRNNYTHEENPYDGFVNIHNDFDACYSWHQIMSDFFQLLAPYLADGSSLEIYPDSGRDYMTIENHKFIQH